jgi:hypothetical protein
MKFWADTSRHSRWDPASDEVMVESFFVGSSSRDGMLIRFFLIKTGRVRDPVSRDIRNTIWKWYNGIAVSSTGQIKN